MSGRKELIEYRTPNTKHFLKKDGTIEVEIYKDPVHYLDKGEYKEIDNSLVKTTKGFKNKSNNFKVEFDEKNSDSLVNISCKSKKLSMFPKNIEHKVSNRSAEKKVKNKIISNSISYENMYKDVDIDYKVLSNQLKESIILNKIPEVNRFSFIINTDLNLVLNDNNTISFMSKNKECYKIEKPYMIDNNNVYSELVKYNLEKIDNGYEVTIVIDNEWLYDKDRAYPVIIDPTITNTEYDSSVVDTYIYEGDDNISTFNQDVLKVGTELINNKNVSYRTLLKFDLPEIPPSYRLIEATLNLSCYPDDDYSSKPDETLISVHRVIKDWTESSAKWKDIANEYSDRVEDSFYSSRTNIADINQDVDVICCSAKITDLVQRWYNNEPNYGLMLKQFEEKVLSNGKIGRFFSKDNGISSEYKPIITLDYRDFNGISVSTKYCSVPIYLGTSYVNAYTGNFISAFNLANTIGGKLPISFVLNYNTADLKSKVNYGFGLGIKPNLVQSIKEIFIEGELVLKYLDESSTNHYFYLNEETNIYEDEDGLQLTAYKENNEYIIIDSESNKSIFRLLADDEYRLMEIIDADNNKINIIYENNLIKTIIDPSQNEINILYSDSIIEIKCPYKNVSLNINNNLLTSITEINETTNFEYQNGLISKIINPDNTGVSILYQNDKSNRVAEIHEVGKNGTIGNRLTFSYGFRRTTIKDQNEFINTYIFDEKANLVSISNLSEQNDINSAYGKTYSFGVDGNQQSLTSDKALIKYVNNYIIDSSFEKKSDKFTVIGSGIAEYIDDSKTGGTSLKFSSNEVSSGIYYNLSLNKESYYTFSVYLKSNAKVKICLSYDTYEESKIIENNTDEFKRYSITIWYPQTAISDLKVQILLSDNGYFVIDDLQLESGEVPNYYNLVDNSDFTYGLDDWEINAEKNIGTLTNPNYVKFDNKKIVNISDTIKAYELQGAPTYLTTACRKFNVKGKAGDVYNLSFWFKNEGIIPSYIETWMDRISVMIFFYYNEEDIEEYGHCVISKELVPYSDEWQFFSENFVAEFDYSDIEIRIFSYNNANSCFFTNFSLFRDLESYSYDYDENGNLISANDLNHSINNFSYNSSNQLSSFTDSLNNNIYYEYSKENPNELFRGVSPSGITSELVYEDDHPVKMKIFNKSFTNSLDEDKNYYIRSKGTNCCFYVDASKKILSKKSECSYDKFRVTKTGENYYIYYLPLPSYYIFDNNGEIILSRTNKTEFSIIQNPDKSYHIVSSSGLYLTMKNNSFTFESLNDDEYSQYFYFEDSENKKFLETSVEYDADGFIIKTIDLNDNVTEYERDTKTDLVSKIKYSNGKEVNYVYNDKFQVVSVSDNRNEIMYEYNGANISKIISNNRIYTFEYDEFNKIIDIKLNNNSVVKNVYGFNNGRLLKNVYGNGSSVSFEYDDFDRLKKIIKNSDTYNNYYDNMGRLAKVESGLGSIVTYEYDFGQRISQVNNNGYVLNYDYDNNNNIIKRDDKYSEHNYSQDFYYNNESVLSKIQIGEDEINYIYDELGRLVETNINNQNSLKTSYIAKGNKNTFKAKEVIDGNDCINFEYNASGCVSKKILNGLLNNEYLYNIYGELIEEKDYSKLERIEYLYDDNGNLLEKKIYNINDNTLKKDINCLYGHSVFSDALTNYNGIDIEYDGMGNPIKIGDSELTWENCKELSSFINADVNISYKYDDDGIRTYKKVNNDEIYYYNEGSKIVFEKRNNDMLYYIYNPSNELIGFIYNNQKYFYDKNIFKDIVGIYDSNLNEIVTYEYDSWGVVTNIIDKSNINLGTINPFRYRSYYYDEEIGLYYLRTRYYNPVWGRFISVDDMISTGQEITGYNLYNYTGNDPINKYDDDGEIWLQVAGGLIGAAVSATTKVITNKIEGKPLTDGVLGAAAGGAVSGVLATTTFGMVHPVASSFVANATEQLVNQLTDDKEGIDFGELALNTTVATAESLAFDAIIPSSGFSEVKKNWIKPSKISTSFLGKFQTRLTVGKLEEASKKIVQVGIFQTGKEFVDFVKGSNKPQSTSSNKTPITSKVSSTIKKVVNKVISKVKSFISNIKAINSRLFSR